MTRRPLIDVFSPLPPLPTAIAENTVGVLSALRTMAEVRVWTAQDQPASLSGWDVEVCHFRADALPLSRLNQADATFYNLGNNSRFHRAIHEAARRVPGVVVLHDTRLQHFFASYAEKPGNDRAFYLGQLERSHGPEALAMGKDFIAGRRGLQDLAEAAPMTLAAAAGATGVIVHNAEERARLAGQIHVPVYYLPLSHAFGTMPERPAPRGANSPTRLVMFGFIGANRRLLAILRLLARMPDRMNYRLDIYGQLEEEVEAAELAADARLQDIVTLHGFVPDAELDAALARADLVLNLRWPSMGEASGSQLRVWAAGCASLVTRVGWYAQLPADTVTMISPEHEAEEMTGHLRALRSDRRPYEQSGLAGRRLLERLHSTNAYAESLLRISLRHAEHHELVQAHALAERAAKRLLDFSTPELARPLGAEIARRIIELTSV